MRRVAGIAGLLVAASVVPATAGQPTLTRPGQRVSWAGEMTVPDPSGCDDVTSRGCVRHEVVVDAAKGTWLTVTTDADYVRVTDRKAYVASNGGATNTRETTSDHASVTFQQLRTGRVTYTVGVSTAAATPASPAPFHATASVSGKAFDRQGECAEGDSGVAALLAPDDGARLRLSVRLVADPEDAALVRKAGAAIVDTYDRIGITVRVSYDLVRLAPLGDDTYPFEQVRRRYGGVRPPGVDAVHVVTDAFAGGFADCLGGVAYVERGFSTGNAHYESPAGGVTLDAVPAGMIAAHEIGHTLGAQHQMVSCAEPAVQQAQRPAKDGWTGACSVMGPLALQDSETFSTLERATVRSFVRRYARG